MPPERGGKQGRHSRSQDSEVMAKSGCGPEGAAQDQRRVLIVALILNVAMFVVDLVGGILGESSGLIADSLDMLADASAYAIAIAAINRSAVFRVNAARFSGVLLLVLGIGVVGDVLRRFIFGSEPIGPIMVLTALLALVANVIVLRLLSRHRDGGVHLKAAWIFTRADVLANVGVILGGIVVSILDSAVPDLVVGFGVGLYVIKESIEILREARLEQRRRDSTST